MNKLLKKLIRFFMVALPCFSAPCLIICISRILFMIAEFCHTALSSYRDVNYWELNMWICLVTTLLAAYSIIRVTVKHNRDLREKYWKNGSKLDVKEQLIFIFRQSKFLIESAVTAMIYIILPTRITLPPLASLFAIGNPFIEKLVALSIFLPVLFVIAMLANLSACGYWWRCRNAAFYGKKIIIKDTLTICLAYLPAEYLIISSIPFIDSNQHIIKQLLTVKLLIALLIPIVIIITYIILRAALKRHKCIKQLKKICHENGYSLSEIQDPYRSVFKVCEGESFKVGIGKKIYSCKFIGAHDSLNPLALYPNGTMVFLDKNPLKVSTIYKFAYESDCPQILIVNPTPRYVYAHQGAGKLVKIDNGDRVGRFKFYTATAFLRALELDVLDR